MSREAQEASYSDHMGVILEIDSLIDTMTDLRDCQTVIPCLDDLEDDNHPEAGNDDICNPADAVLDALREYKQRFVDNARAQLNRIEEYLREDDLEKAVREAYQAMADTLDEVLEEADGTL